MLRKELAIQKINAFRIRYGIDTTDENIVTTIHLMNAHGLEHNAAKDQSSRSANDKGIDGWFYDERLNHLYIYQSKLTESKGLALRGLSDLHTAMQWLTQVIVDGELEKIPVDNHMLYGLYMHVAGNKEQIRQIRFVLISLFESSELEDDPDIDAFSSTLAKSALNRYVTGTLNGKLKLDTEPYCFETSIPRSIKTYDVHKFSDSNITLRSNAGLHLSYVSLFSLVELFRQRGNILFDKNVRLSLFNTKDAKDRLVHPLFETLELITRGKLQPQIFPFYHVGITITATSVADSSDNQFSLESPGVINGCQTITIAHEYLKKIEKIPDDQERDECISRFKQIQLIAKIVVGVNEDELKEITNANNRQNPIDNWQLFSNEPVHIAIETALRDKGIFYERQKGKFDTIMKIPDNARHYHNTRGTYITIPQLGQLIALARMELQMAAKPALIFENKKNHDLIFNNFSFKAPDDIVFCFNIFKSLARALKNYLDYPTHADHSFTHNIFSKPMVRAHLFYIGLLYYYQLPRKQDIRNSYSTSLLKKASTPLIDDMESSFFARVIAKFRDWYLVESKSMQVDVSVKKLTAYSLMLASDLGVDTRGRIPFTSSARNWSEYQMTKLA